MAAATVPKNQIFTFDSSSTIGDLLLVVRALKNAGQTPKLRLVAAYNGQIESVAVDVLQLADEPCRCREMAVAGADNEPPDPAASLSDPRD